MFAKYFLVCKMKKFSNNLGNVTCSQKFQLLPLPFSIIMNGSSKYIYNIVNKPMLGELPMDFFKREMYLRPKSINLNWGKTHCKLWLEWESVFPTV